MMKERAFHVRQLRCPTCYGETEATIRVAQNKEAEVIWVGCEANHCFFSPLHRARILEQALRKIVI